MARIEDVTITLRAVDEVTPVIKRVRRQLWWMKYGDTVVAILAALLGIAAFILGRVTA